MNAAVRPLERRNVSLYRIREWKRHFEKNRSHGKSTPSRVSIPNRLDGASYAELIEDHADGPAHFGAWIVLLEVASACNPRGTLVRSNGQPHDTLSLARVTKFPERIITDALQRLVKLGWIEVSEVNGIVPNARDGLTPGAQRGQATAVVIGSNKTLFLGETLNTEKTEEPERVRMLFPCLDGESFSLTESKAREYEETYLAIDVAAELRRALQWCRDNPRNIKTVSGMPRFLGNWLGKEQNRAGRVQTGGRPQQKASGDDLKANILKNLGGKR
jgi:hypothetical protein